MLGNPEMLLGNPEMFLDFPATKQTILSRLQTLLVMSVDVEAAALVTSAAFIVIQLHKRARRPKLADGRKLGNMSSK